MTYLITRGESEQPKLDAYYRKCLEHDYPFISVRTGPGKASVEWDICFSPKLVALMETRGELFREFLLGLLEFFGVSQKAQVFNKGMEGHVGLLTQAKAKELADELSFRLPSALGLLRSAAPWEQQHPLSEDLVNKGVVAFLNVTNIGAGSTSHYDLYRLMQAYLLDDQKRIQLNNVIGVKGPNAF